MHLDAVILARLQFALTIMFHYIFPPITIGLGVLLVVFEGLWLKTNRQVYHDILMFWIKIFAVNFAIGVATGIVMEFEFGTNWATYSRYVGDVFGSALAAEGIFAFFLESGFLSILLFGANKVSKQLHFLSTIMVCLGSIFSSVWIVIANSFQQTPAGYHLVKQTNGFIRAEITDFWAMVFNPSSMYRLNHVLLGAIIIGASLVISVSSYYLLKKIHEEFAQVSFKISLIVLTIASYTMLLSGHEQAKAVAFNQPAKLAAFEGNYHTCNTHGTRLSLFGIPNPQTMTLQYEVSIPDLLSLLVYNNFNKPVTALDAFPKSEWPPLLIPFFSYHIMVGIGMLYIALSTIGIILLKTNNLFKYRILLWVYVFLAVIGTIANQVGWIACEVGRQPWIVYGLLKTSDAVSKTVDSGQIIMSITMFGLLYLLLFFVYIYILNEKIQLGPVRNAKFERSSILDAASDLSKHGEFSLTSDDETKEVF